MSSPVTAKLVDDMRARGRPDAAAVAVAVAALNAAEPGLLAAIPMTFPGKTRGRWTAGQEVITLHGTVLIGRNGDPQSLPGILYPSYSQARDQAAEAARTALNGEPGTVGWATVYPEGTWAVTEDHR